MIDREENPNEKEDVEQTEQIENVDGSKWKKHLKKKLTNAEILSQSLIFLMAGYETTASTLEFVTYNLVKHPLVQQKLCDEIDQVLEKHV
jgi:cytochrome P450